MDTKRSNRTEVLQHERAHPQESQCDDSEINQTHVEPEKQVTRFIVNTSFTYRMDTHLDACSGGTYNALCRCERGLTKHVETYRCVHTS
jgi:hypothetical protein